MLGRKYQKIERVKSHNTAKSDRVIIRNSGKIIRIVRKGKK